MRDRKSSSMTSIQDPDYDITADLEGERRVLLKKTDPSDPDVIIVSRQVPKGSSWYASVFLVVNAALGAGLLNFPAAYQQAGGVMVAVVIQAIMLVFVVCAILILAYCSDINKTATYQDVVLSVCGKNAQRFAAFTLLLYCFGTCITFLIIIGDQWEEFFLTVVKEYYCKENPWFLNRASTICITSLILILPLCFPKRIDFLKYASIIGVIGILYVVLLVTIKYFLPHTKKEPGPIKLKPTQWEDVFLVIPTICFSYQCHVSIIPIYSCMEKRGIREFSKTVTVAMILCVINYTGTAAFGYLTFGDNITEDILLSYEPDPEVLVAVVLIAVKTYTTYPILLFCGRAAFNSLWTDIFRMSPDEVEATERKRRIVVTLIWFVLTLALAVFIPNIGIVIQILGAFAAIFIFIFPGMCVLAVVMSRVDSTGLWTRRLRAVAALACLFMIIGAFIFGLTLSQSILKDKGGVKADKSNYTCDVQ